LLPAAEIQQRRAVYLPLQGMARHLTPGALLSSEGNEWRPVVPDGGRSQ
jgi:hypothetical protein